MILDTIFNKAKFRETFSPAAEAPEKKKTDGGTVHREVAHMGDPRRAQKVAAVYAAVRILSDAVASLPLLYQRWSNVDKRYVNNDETATGRLQSEARLFYCLTQRANQRMTAFQFFKNLVSQVLLYGNAYAMPIRDMQGKVQSIILLDPSTEYMPYSDKYAVTEKYWNISGIYDSSEILHFKNVSLDGGYTGVSTIHFAATQLNIAGTAANETLDRFATGGRGKFLYHNNTQEGGASFSPEFDDEELLASGDDIQEQLNEGRDVIVMRGDGKLEPMSMTAADLQYLSSQEFNIREICRFFGIPLSKMFEKGDQTYKSVDAANIALYSEGLRPLLENICQEFNTKLIPWNLSTTYRFVFDTNPLYLTDKTTQVDYITKRIQSGTLTINEARAEMNLSPVEGGDEVIVSTNMAGVNNDKISGGGEDDESQTAEQSGTEPEDDGNGNGNGNGNDNENKKGRERDARGRFVKTKK